jgi:hypothetical protein
MIYHVVVVTALIHRSHHHKVDQHNGIDVCLDM